MRQEMFAADSGPSLGPVDDALYGVYQYRALGAEDEKHRRALGALVRIHGLATQGDLGIGGRDATIAKIIKEAEEGAAYSPDIFGSFVDAIKGNPGKDPLDLFGDVLSWGTGVAVALTPVLPISAAGAAALGVAAITVKPVVNFVGEQNAKYIPRPQIEIGGIASFAYARTAQLMRENPRLAAWVENENLKSFAGLQLSQGRQAAQNVVPPQMRPSSGGRDATAQLVKVVRDEMQQVAKKIAEEQQKLVTAVASNWAEWRRRQEIEQRLAAIHDGAREIEGLGKTAGFLVSALGGDPNLARGLSVMGSIVGQLYNSAGLFEAGKLGTFALTGNVFGAISAFMSLGQPSEMAVIHEALENIQKTLGRIEQRLDRIEQAQITIINQLQQLTTEVRRGVVEARSNYDTLRNLVLAIGKNAADNARAIFTEPYNETAAQLRSLVKLPPNERASDVVVESFRKHLTSLHNLGTTTTKVPALTGRADVDATWGTIGTNIILAQRADALFGTLPRCVALLGMTWPEETERANRGNLIPNPLAWRDCVLSYLQVRAAVPELARHDLSEHLAGFFEEGMRLKEAVLTVCDNKIMKAAGTSVITKSEAILQLIKRCAERVEAEHLTKKFTIEHVTGGSGVVYHQGRGSNFVERRDFDKNLRISHDPLDQCLALKLLRLETTWSQEIPQRRSFSYKLWILVGKNAGKQLLPEELGEHHVSGHTQRIWNPANRHEYGSDPVPMLNACYELLREHEDPKHFKAHFPDALKQDLNTARPKLAGEECEGASAILRLFGTIALWRSQQGQASWATPHLANVSGPFDIDGIVALSLYTLKDYPFTATNRIEELVAKIRDQIAESVAKIVSLGDGTHLSKGLPEVDDCLSKLASIAAIYGVTRRA